MESRCGGLKVLSSVRNDQFAREHEARYRASVTDRTGKGRCMILKRLRFFPHSAHARFSGRGVLGIFGRWFLASRTLRVD